MPEPRISDVRCPRCHRLLAKKLPNGGLEIKSRGVLVARVYCGEVHCADCNFTYFAFDPRRHPVVPNVSRVEVK